MSNQPHPTNIDKAIASDWLRYSLGQGDVISPDVLKFIQERNGRAYALVPATVDPERLTTPQWGGVIEPGTVPPREALAQVLEGLAVRGAACVVVEDAVRERRDPKPSVDGLLPTAFVGEHVVHWAALATDVKEAVVAVHRGSGGYPTNAFVTSAPAEELGLVEGSDMNSDVGGAVVVSLVAVIVAAYDDETYIIWEPR